MMQLREHRLDRWLNAWRSSRGRPLHLKSEAARIEAVKGHQVSLAKLSDQQLRSAADGLREEYAAGKARRQDHNAQLLAVAADAVRRATGKQYYDVQLMAGAALIEGAIAEMQTGEGKTLATVLPALHHAIHGRQVHVGTSNAYLANRDHAELAPVLDLLGVTHAALPGAADLAGKRRAYQQEVVFGPGYEFGFDYLRDQLALRESPSSLGRAWIDDLAEGEGIRLLQPRREAAVMDEADSVLIDEALTPLVLSGIGDAALSSEPFLRTRALVNGWQEGKHFTFDRKLCTAPLTALGHADAAHDLASRGVHGLRRPWRIYVEQALRARVLMRVDVDYVIQDQSVVLVDQSTGRLFPDRKWRDGLHQAVECREQLPLTPETLSLARISRQRFFRLYEHQCGMTGTAASSAAEFRQVYGLPVILIPTHRPCRRRELPLQVFADQASKLDAIADDIAVRHATGQPILAGARTIHDSRELSERLAKRGLPHLVLNGVQDAEEAAIIAQAGRGAAITIATNMAGRGADIVLDEQARRNGGLHVIRVEPHDSRRVDRQLMGRCARQGDPGSYQPYVAADDMLLVQHAPRLAESIRRQANRQGRVASDRAANLGNALLQVQTIAEAVSRTARWKLVQQGKWTDQVVNALAGERIE